MAQLPPGHTRIDDHNLKNLTIKNNELYWDGNKVRAETKLSFVQKFWAILIGGIALFGSLASAINSGISINKELCWIDTVSCQKSKAADQAADNSKASDQKGADKAAEAAPDKIEPRASPHQ